MIRGMRGATTVAANDPQEMVAATEELLAEIIEKNSVEATDVSSIFISVTEDLNAAFPARALRSFKGWSFVPVVCMREIPVPGSLEKCIRVMMHVNTEIPQENIRHIYLKGAVILRPDLQKEELKG